MKCDKSFRICKEWAADFRQVGSMNVAGFWEGMSLAFTGKISLFMPEDEMQSMIDELNAQASMHPQTLKMVMGTVSKRQIQDMEDIHQERLFMIEKLNEMKQKMTL